MENMGHNCSLNTLLNSFRHFLITLIVSVFRIQLLEELWPQMVGKFWSLINH